MKRIITILIWELLLAGWLALPLEVNRGWHGGDGISTILLKWDGGCAGYNRLTTMGKEGGPQWGLGVCWSFGNGWSQAFYCPVGGWYYADIENEHGQRIYFKKHLPKCT